MLTVSTSVSSTCSGRSLDPSISGINFALGDLKPILQIKEVSIKPFNPESLKTEIKEEVNCRCLALMAVQYIVQVAKVGG